MSKVYDKYRVPGQPDTWYVKMSDGSIYGPETYAAVYGWAAEGRIAPGDQISQDMITWVFAENVARLKMDWIAEMDGGRKYGPFNLLAVPNLVRHGTFKNDAKVVNRFTGKSLPIDDVLKPAVAAELIAQSDLVTVRDDTPNVAGAIPPIQEHIGKREHHKHRDTRHGKESGAEHRGRDLDRPPSKVHDELADARQALDESRRRHQELEDDKRKQLEHLNGEISRLEREKSAATATVEELKKAAEHEKHLVATLRSSSNEKEKELAGQIGILQRNVSTLNSALEETTAKFEEQRRQLLSVTDQTKDAELETSQRLARLINQTQSTQDSLDKAEKTISEQQQRISVLSREQAAAEQTLKRLNEELEKNAGDKAKILEQTASNLENERKLRAEAETKLQEIENAHTAEIRGLKDVSAKTLHEKSVALEQATGALEKEKSQHLETQAKHKEIENRYADDIRNLKSEIAKSAKLLDETGAQLDNLRKENKALAARSVEREREFMNALDEKAKLVDQTRNEMDRERKDHEAHVRSLSEADEDIHRELDENHGLLERVKRDLEKEKSLRAAADEKRIKTEELLEVDMRNLKAQATGVTVLLEAARRDLTKEREEYNTLTRTLQDKENQLLAAVEEKAQIAEATARSNEQIKKLERKITETEEAGRLLASAQADLEKERKEKKSLADAAAAKEAELISRIQQLEQEIRNGGARNEEPAGQPQKRETEQPVQRPEELEDERTRAEILPQEAAELTEEKPQAETAVNKWYLRTEDGSVYGPVDISELCEWAGQCRVQPSHEVSQDRSTWVPAGSIADLKMDWIVDLPDGSTYGPVNALALQNLVHEGVVPIDARVVNKTTLETASPDQLLQTPGVDSGAGGMHD